MNKVKELESKINGARNEYYNGEAQVSDLLFDTWIAELAELDPDNSAIVSIGSPVVSSPWKKAEHKIPMGSLDKVNTPEELKQWVAKTCPGAELFLSEKLDGISIELLYEKGKLLQAITRGSGYIGEDITVNVARMGGIVKKLPKSTFTGSFRGEIILTKDNHQKHFPDKANLRNTASGVSKRLDGAGSEYLNVLLYQVLGDEQLATEKDQFDFLHKMGCKTPNHQVLCSPELVIEKWEEYQASIRGSLNYDIDGIVIRVNNLEEQLALGDKDMRPKGAVAFKFANEAKETTIKEIIFQTGNTGRCTPVAILEPVILCGAKIERASLYNMAYIRELGIGVGAQVLLVRAGDVIPRVQAVLAAPAKVMEAPENCPTCDTAIEVNGEYLECPNEDCFAQVIGRIKNWVSDLNILELGETLIEKLVADGLVEDVSDLYLLTEEQLATVDRMGEKSALNVITSIESRNPVSLDILLGALSIPMIGSSSIRLLIEAGYNSLDKILVMTQKQMEAIKGMGPGRASSLVSGLKKNKEMIMKMIENGVKIKEQAKNSTGKLAGKSFCFTGTMVNKRSILQQMVLDAGGTCKNSVSKGLDFLVLEDTTTTKAAKAEALGTKCISENDFLAMV